MALFSHTDLSIHCQETGIFPDQNFKNTDNKCNSSDTTEPTLEQMSTPQGGLLFLVNRELVSPVGLMENGPSQQ